MWEWIVVDSIFRWPLWVLLTFRWLLITLLIGFRTVYLQRLNNKNSVKPYASFPSNNTKQLINFRIKNSGIWPMIIKSVKITFDDEEKDWIFKFFRDSKNISIEEIQKIFYINNYWWVKTWDTFSPNEEFELISFKLRDNIEIENNDEFTYVFKNILYILSKIKIELVYCDLYKNKNVSNRKLEDNFGNSDRYKQRVKSETNPDFFSN